MAAAAAAPPASTAAPTPAPAPPAPAAESTSTKECWVWRCAACERECLPIRAQSRCMCGHFLASHGRDHACTKTGCSCPCFVYIVAEGSWVLKCRCKHKHTDHTPGGTHACKRCNCTAFDSPWVCNCDHPWAEHQQLLVNKQVVKLSDMLAQQPQLLPCELQLAGSGAMKTAAAGLTCEQLGSKPEVLLVEGDLLCEVNRFDALQRGKQ